MRTPMGMEYVAVEDLDRMENELREAERELATPRNPPQILHKLPKFKKSAVRTEV